MAWESEDPATGKILPVRPLTRNDNFPDHAFDGPGWPSLEKSLAIHGSLGSCVVVTPYTPRHKRYLDRSMSCLENAKAYSSGPFDEITQVFYEDKDLKGPGYARNQIIGGPLKPDWYFFVDADDMIKRHTFEAMNWLLDRDGEVTDIVWGQIEHRGTRMGEVMMLGNAGAYEPFGWNRFLARGHDRGGGINCGFFARGDLIRRYQWFEGQFTLEDIEYFTTIMSEGTFLRLPFPLVTVDSMSASTRDTRKTKKGLNRKKNTLFDAIRAFWRRNGRRPLHEEVREIRNTVALSGEGMVDFYGRG